MIEYALQVAIVIALFILIADVSTINHREFQIMATIQEVLSKVGELTSTVLTERAEVQAGFADLRAQIKALADQLANGTVVTPADLDNLVASLDQINTAIKAISEPEPVPV